MDYSARSRVRGTLEVYHAFIRDLDASDTSTSTGHEQDWEIVDDSEHVTDGESSSQVNIATAFDLTNCIVCKYNFFLLSLLVDDIEYLCTTIRPITKWLGGTNRCKWSNILCESYWTIYAVGTSNKVYISRELCYFDKRIFLYQMFHIDIDIRVHRPRLILMQLPWNLSDVFILVSMRPTIVIVIR